MNKQSWDEYFMNIVYDVAKKSKSISRKIGAVIVRDNCIIGTGFNGAARGVKECNERDAHFYSILANNEMPIEFNESINKCPRKEFGYKSGEGLHLCQAIHAEVNCIAQAARMGISTKEATIYINLSPCVNCMGSIINAGIKRIVYPKGLYYDKYSNIIAKEAKIEICEMENKK